MSVQMMDDVDRDVLLAYIQIEMNILHGITVVLFGLVSCILFLLTNYRPKKTVALPPYAMNQNPRQHIYSDKHIPSEDIKKYRERHIKPNSIDKLKSQLIRSRERLKNLHKNKTQELNDKQNQQVKQTQELKDQEANMTQRLKNNKTQQTNLTQELKKKHPKNATKKTAKTNAVQSQGQCTQIRFQSADKLFPKTGLISYAGSGNTWTRYLIEQLTGFYTGAIYLDTALKKKFPGENIQTGKVIAIKSHEYDNHRGFKKVILLIRNPYDAIIAEFNRLKKGHTGCAPAELFTKPGFETHVNFHIRWWKNVNNFWLKFKGPLHIVFYEHMKVNLREELKRLATFLNQNVTEERLDCVMKNQIGKFKRKKCPNMTSPYNSSMIEKIDSAIDHIYKIALPVLKTESDIFLSMKRSKNKKKLSSARKRI